jgi:hypothetical protein
MPSIIQRLTSSAIDTALQMFWGAVLAALLGGGLLIYRLFGGLSPRWTDGVMGALIASAFIAVVAVVLTFVRDWLPPVQQVIFESKTPTGLPAMPLPSAIGPADRKRILLKLKQTKKLTSMRTARPSRSEFSTPLLRPRHI